MENGSHPTQEAKVIPLAPYLNKKAMQEAGRIVFRRLGADAEGSQSEPLARVYDISSRFSRTTAPEAAAEEDITTGEQDTEREVIAEMVEDITTNLEALPKCDSDIGGFLDIINGQLEDCYEELSPDQKKKLAIKLTSVLGESHENLSKAVVHHPNFVRLLGVALSMQYDPNFRARGRHPSYRPVRDAITTAKVVLSLTPGTCDLGTGDHTPPER
ncbi:hypothetical protein [Candidatus Nanosynbacter featherlites]|uniref:Uncharacterized protein n=1 Tax=Candidatus Nanosynbacter featherlites TaxID=2572088 RepID=A0A4P9A2V6_9BACT|nr:hypothetical protein [Candidatus Nanosynbacter featherlites]QCT42112.1 hypothetical protein FBF37_01320 [Candidatus Nanosynbacter featherlites]